MRNIKLLRTIFVTIPILTAGGLFLSVSSSWAHLTFRSFNVCNETGEKISVAIAYHNDQQQWTSKGWYELNQTQCSRIHNSLENTRFYLYAKGESGKIWGANHPFCVLTRRFKIENASDQDSCRKQENFFSVWVPDPVTGKLPPSYVYTFGPNNINLNNPRAER